MDDSITLYFLGEDEQTLDEFINWMRGNYDWISFEIATIPPNSTEVQLYSEVEREISPNELDQIIKYFDETHGYVLESVKSENLPQQG